MPNENSNSEVKGTSNLDPATITKRPMAGVDEDAGPEDPNGEDNPSRSNWLDDAKVPPKKQR